MSGNNFTLNLLIIYRKIRGQCKQSDQALCKAVEAVDNILGEGIASETRPWAQLATAVLEIPIPEAAFWHDAVFAIARISNVLYTIGALDFHIIPDAKKYGYIDCLIVTSS